MRMYFATWMEAGQAIALTDKEAVNRLLSYHFIDASAPSNDFMPKYVTTGLIPQKKKSKRKRRK